MNVGSNEAPDQGKGGKLSRVAFEPLPHFLKFSLNSILSMSRGRVRVEIWRHQYHGPLTAWLWAFAAPLGCSHSIHLGAVKKSRQRKTLCSRPDMCCHHCRLHCCVYRSLRACSHLSPPHSLPGKPRALFKTVVPLLMVQLSHPHPQSLPLRMSAPK
jgi:hypothetical protein